MNKLMVFQAIALLINSVQCHSNMQTPPPRGNVEFTGYCSRGWGCGTVCDSPKAQSSFNSPYNQKKIIRRGDKLDVTWLRQNHPGGFVRLAFSTFDNSDTGSSFDSNIAKYVCYETNCKESHHDNMLGNLNGPGSAPCSTQVTIPNNLPDGPVTLQWTWFGGGVLFANQDAAFANYVSCSDMVVAGGANYDPAPTKPIFQGGDAGNPNSNQCRYWSSNTVGDCQTGAEGGFAEGSMNNLKCGYGPVKNGTPAGMGY